MKQPLRKYKPQISDDKLPVRNPPAPHHRTYNQNLDRLGTIRKKHKAQARQLIQ